MITFLGTPAEGQALGTSLDNILRQDKELEGHFYRGFPIISSSEGGIKLDALLCTKECGVSIIHFNNNRFITEDDIDHVDEVHLKVTARLSELKELTKNRKLIVPVNSITFAPLIPNGYNQDLIEAINVCRTPEEVLASVKSESLPSPSLLKPTLSRLQSLSSLKKTKKRSYIKSDDSKGAVLKNLEGELATLDISQTRAVLENIEGVQRIRGLAGSGKTVVLARKVAHIHSQNPNWKIAVTFNSRSLKEQFKRLITQFYEDATGEQPDWDMVNILHAWGSPKSTGVYYEACCSNNVNYYDWSSAKRISNTYGKEFETVCELLLDQVSDFTPLYDLILIDEAQDFSNAFLKICYAILKNPKKLIYAYDELQNLGDNGMSSPDEIWGLDASGNPIVTFDKAAQDIILDVCYRNPGNILTAAHALGFGVYHNPMIQMFDYPELWGEIGYEIVNGELKENSIVTLSRSNHSSPALLKGHNAPDETLQVKKFNNDMEQAQWIAEQIEKNINEDEILASDIVVIHPNALRLRNEVGNLRNFLFQKGINSSIAGVTASPDEFFSDNSITFTSIYRAKGNEAAMVYIMHSEYCNSDYELSKKRNILFTAMTRTKAWLRICGVGTQFDGIINEYNKIIENNYTLNFRYPTESERQKMRVVNRDMTSSEKRRVNAAKRSAENLSNLLDGEVNLEDIPEEIRLALLAKLSQR
ncbi:MULTISPECIES: DEAD/DEAH box helicase [unclassified Shewanella]|jgi:superfamily I DNA and RNA helicase|uniref:DEAD/DEAH box helicase n=1 Tax=unclassified Shewanella TaxID=196818 RepID=UPI0039B38C91